MALSSIEDDWQHFMDMNYNVEQYIEENIEKKIEKEEIPKCGDIYISTQTKISYLNQQICIEKLFWDIPVCPYHIPKECVIKKQMKSTTFSKEETDDIESKIQETPNCKHKIISHFDNSKTKAAIKYKHVKKISIGISKKDLTSYRSKEKQAFYNCFALILRIKCDVGFKEVHIKVFNTGKLEIPGIQNDETLYHSLDLLISIMQPYVKEKLYYRKETIDTVLINSNFNCGYYINREELFHRLKYKYKLISMYDPCSYPGIQSKFYFNNMHHEKNGVCTCEKKCSKKGSGSGDGECKEISFMIFRTGSVLIVGNCDETILRKIYAFIKHILEQEYQGINEGKIIQSDKKPVVKKVKKYIITKEIT